MNAIPLKLSLTIFFSFLIISIAGAQLSNFPSPSPSPSPKPKPESPSTPSPNIPSEPINCGIYANSNIILWRRCQCEINPSLRICTDNDPVESINPTNNLTSANEERTLLPNASFAMDNLSIDSKLRSFSNIKVQIFDIFTSQLKHELEFNDSGKSGSKIDFDDVILSEGLYLIVMNIDGFISTDKLVVNNR